MNSPVPKCFGYVAGEVLTILATIGQEYLVKMPVLGTSGFVLHETKL